MNLQTELAPHHKSGLLLRNPVITAAGTFGYGIEYVKIDPKSAPDLCTGDECRDGILVRRLQGELANIQKSTVIVLHMMGNHGPAYYLRYPPEFRRFTPDCATAVDDVRRATILN